MKAGQKFSKLRSSLKPRLSQEEMSRELGVKRSTLAQWEVGKNNPPVTVVRAASERWNIPIGWFYDGEDSPVPLEGEGYLSQAESLRKAASHSSRLGRYLFPLRGGSGTLASDTQIEGYVEFSDTLYSPNSKQYVIRVWGDSMEPRFLHGDYILVQEESGFRAAGRCVVVSNPDGRYLVRVLVIKDNIWQLASVNPSYESIRLDEPGWSLIGFAIGWQRDRGRGSYIEEGDTAGLRCD